MGIFKKDKKEQNEVDKGSIRPSGVKLGFSLLRRQLNRYKSLVIQHLEHIDARLSTRQRKWLFYIGIMCWSSFLFYLLGTAIRRPPASFVLPFTADSSKLSLRQLNSRVPEEQDIKRPERARIVTPTVTHTHTDYSPLKIDSHGTNQAH